MYKPFKIHIKLGAPVCLTYPFLHLDGIVAFLEALDKFGQQLFEFSRREETPQFTRDLPLKRTGNVYHASAALFEPHGMMRLIRIYKRFEVAYSDALKKRKLHINSGHFRSFAVAEPYISAMYVTFYGNGDIERISYLFHDYLVALGNDVRIGFGAVRQIKVIPTDTDQSLIKAGRAMRAIPIEMCARYSDAVYMSYKPPYWYRSNRAVCVPPGGECELDARYLSSLE